MEAPSKNRRGRPSRLSAGDLAAARRVLLSEGVKPTPRQVENLCHQGRAQALVENDPGCKWLCDTVALWNGVPGSFKTGLITELGRQFANDDDLLAMARLLCERKPTFREARRIIRSALGKSLPPANAVALADRIITTINKYCETHRGATVTLARKALAQVTILEPDDDGE